jgi:hypothetical protein
MPVTVRNTDILFNDNSTLSSNPIPAGTVMLFVQTAAPTSWTKSTAHNNKALRVVTGTAGSGGSAAFTTAFGTPSVSGSLSGTVGNTTLSTAQIPSHTHPIQSRDTNSDGGQVFTTAGGTSSQTLPTNSTGGGGAHNHSFSGSLSSATAAINVQYVDVIIATKN